MKKTLWVLLLAAVLLLTGCTAEEVQETTVPPLVEVEVPYEETTAEGKYAETELTFQSIWTREDPCARVLTEAAALFEHQTGAAVTILWPENTAPQEEEPQADMFQLSWADFAAIPSGELLDLTELAENAAYAEQSYETLREQIVQQCGYLGAIAQTPYLGGIYYSTDVFEEYGIQQTPQTWEEFLVICQALRAAGWQPLTMDREDALVAMELHLRRSLGNEEMERLMGKGRWNTDLPAIAVLEQVRLFVQEGNMATGSPAEHPAGQNKIATSNSAMMIGTNADCMDVEEAALTDMNWGVFPYPGSTGSGLYMSADVIAISPDCENPQAAFDFLMLLVTGEFDQLRADLSEGIPADPRNASAIAGAMEALETMKPEPLRYFGKKQLDTAVKLWSGWYREAAQYASLLELSK